MFQNIKKHMLQTCWADSKVLVKLETTGPLATPPVTVTVYKGTSMSPNDCVRKEVFSDIDAAAWFAASYFVWV